MVLYLGADHRGFKLKEHLEQYLKTAGHEVYDLGNAIYDENDDYPDFAAAVARKVSAHPGDRGIVICGSGVGADITANKFPGVRSALLISSTQIKSARFDDDVNILSIAADFTDVSASEEVVRIFLETAYRGEERYERRINKIKDVEREIMELM